MDGGSGGGGMVGSGVVVVWLLEILQASHLFNIS